MYWNMRRGDEKAHGLKLEKIAKGNRARARVERQQAKKREGRAAMQWLKNLKHEKILPE